MKLPSKWIPTSTSIAHRNKINIYRVKIINSSGVLSDSGRIIRSG